MKFPPSPGIPPSRLDTETGLCNAATFIAELSRRFDRLDVEEQPGSLFYLSFSSDRAELRGTVAMQLANQLKDIARPTDLLGRIDETTLALWCDGMDHLAGGERAARLCMQLPPPAQPGAAGGGRRTALGTQRRRYRYRHQPCRLRFADRRKSQPAAEAPCSTWRVWHPAL